MTRVQSGPGVTRSHPQSAMIRGPASVFESDSPDPARQPHVRCGYILAVQTRQALTGEPLSDQTPDVHARENTPQDPAAEERTSRIRMHLPVTVVLERREIIKRFWSAPSWYLSGVLVGESLTAREDAEPLRETAQGREFAWSGHRVTLYKDACERYWHALIGERPLVYVVCRERAVGDDERGPGIEPTVVTIDYDQAIAFAETDELVLSADITPELYRYMEAFVLEHYRPEPFEKRRRKRWVDGEGGGKGGQGAGRA